MGIVLRPDLPFATKGLAESTARSEAKLAARYGGDRWDGRFTPYLASAAHDNAMSRAWLDAGDRAIRIDLDQLACASAAAHAAAMTPGSDPLRTPAPGGGTVEVDRSAGRPQPLRPPVHWHDGVLAALICRRHDVLAVLTGLDPDRLARQYPAPPWFLPEVRMFGAIVAGGDDAAEIVAGATAAMAAAHVDEVSRPWADEVVGPELRLAAHSTAGDQGTFDEELHEAVRLHDRYFGRETAVRYHGRLALVPLALAALAHDRGIATTLESDYAPRWLIEATD